MWLFTCQDIKSFPVTLKWAFYSQSATAIIFLLGENECKDIPALTPVDHILFLLFVLFNTTFFSIEITFFVMGVTIMMSWTASVVDLH